VLLGHSLGAHACLLHMALTGGVGANGLVLVATGLAYRHTYPGARGYVTLVQTQGIGAAVALLGVWPGWGFGGRQARGVIRDWAYCARRGEYPSMGGVDPRAALAAMRNAVLAVSVEDDRYTPGSGLDHLCGKLPAAPVERVHYTTAEAGAPLDHLTWVRRWSAGPQSREVRKSALNRFFNLHVPPSSPFFVDSSG
jgi:predicted alpha/beta hydrolase